MKKVALFVLTLLPLLAFGGALDAAVLFQDNFNAENGGSGTLNYNGFVNWTVSSGTVDLIGNGFFDFYPGNGLYVDLDGSTSQAGIMTTNQTFAPGTYQLTFNLAGSARGDTNIVDVALADFSTSFTVPSNDPFSPARSLTFTTATSGPLSFHNEGGDNLGAILDNVQVATTIPGVPEPSVLLLLGLGLIGVGGVRRFKK